MLVFKIEKKKHHSVHPPMGPCFANGQWSTKEMWVVYASDSIALAKLETLANCGSGIPENRFVLTLKIFDAAPLIQIAPEDLPKNWYDIPYPRDFAEIVREIMATKEYVGVLVPSNHQERITYCSFRSIPASINTSQS